MPVLLDIKTVKVRSLDVDFHEVSWELKETSEDVLDYSFQVLRSESPSGPFDLLTEQMEDRYVFIDTVIQIANRWRQYYYLIRVTQKSTGDYLDFGPASKEPDPDIIAMEIRRHILLLFREFAGRRLWVLPIRTFGQRCECWNKITNSARRSGCPLCFDTRWVRGYMSPIETWGQIDPSADTEQVTTVGKQQQVNTTARFGYYPSLKPKDVIVEGENRRWRVVSISQTEKARAGIHQEVQIHEIPTTDIEFKIPLNMDTALKDLWLSPSRNFTNPQSLQSFESEEVPGIFALYPSTYTRPR